MILTGKIKAIKVVIQQDNNIKFYILEDKKLMKIMIKITLMGINPFLISQSNYFSQ